MRILFYLLITALISRRQATANVELANFPHFLCPATNDQDKQASEMQRAAAQLSANWPKLRLSSTSPSLFSLSAPAEESDNHDTRSSKGDSREDKREDLDPFSSSQGAWITLDLDTEEFNKSRNKGDLISIIKRKLLENYQLRVSWPANFPVDLSISIHTPSSMLSLGSVVWQTEEELRSAVMTPAPTHMAEPTSTASSHQSKEEGNPSPKSSGSGDQANLVPCSTLYAHIGARSHSVRIPSKSTSKNLNNTFFNHLFKFLDIVSSYLYDPLVPDYHPTCSSNEMQRKLAKVGVVGANQAITSSISNPKPTSLPRSQPVESENQSQEEEDFKCTAPLLVPIHLTLEHFYFGAIPATALDLLILLLPLLSFTLVFILPRIQRSIRKLLEETDERHKRE